MAFRSSLNNYYSLPDHADFIIPNTDWTILNVIYPTDTTTGQDIFSTAEWGTAQSFNTYIFAGEFGIKVHTLTEPLVASVVANQWTLTAGRRSGSNFAMHSIPLGGHTVSSSSNTAISASYNAANTITIGRRSDDGTNPFLGRIADIVWVPGHAVSNADLELMANGFPIWCFGWAKDIRFHFWTPTANEKYLMDLSGRHLVTASGTTFLQGVNEVDPPEIKRFPPIPSAPQLFLVSVVQSDLSAAGVGGFSANSGIRKLTDWTAAGVGGFTADTQKTVQFEWTAAGVGGATLESNKRIETELTAAGAGGFTGNSQTTTSADLTAAGAGAANFDMISQTTELTADGVGGFTANTTALSKSNMIAIGEGDAFLATVARKPTELTAAGVGAASFDIVPASKTELTAGGVGGFSGITNVGFRVKLTAVGTGSNTFISGANKRSTLTAAGAGDANFDSRFFSPMEFQMAGVGSAVFRITSQQVPATIAGSNLYLIPENYIDTATLVASSTATGYDIENIKLDRKLLIWRSTDGNLQTVTATWADTRLLSAVGFAFTNLVKDAVVRVKYYTLPTDPSPAYDSGEISIAHAYPPPSGFDTISSASFAFGGGNYFSHLFASTQGRKLEIDVTNNLSADGFTEVSRIIAGAAYTPVCGAEYGANLSFDDRTKIKESAAGESISKKGASRKVINFSMGALEPLSRRGFAEVLKNRGASNPVFLSMYENSPEAEERNSFIVYGRINTGVGLAVTDFNNHGTTLNITEI